MDKKIKGYECKFAVYCPMIPNFSDDYHLVKENIHYTDGTVKPNLRLIKNFKRDFYVTKKFYRNHNSKKEWESLDKVNKYTCTQRELKYAVAKALEVTYMGSPDMRQLSDSPYLYGTDIKSTALIRHQYAAKYPDLISLYSVCSLDIETDVVSTERFGEINIISACMSDKVVCTVNSYFIKDIPDAKEKILASIEKYIGEYTNKRKMQIYIHICDNEMDCIYKVFEYIHKWKPDFLTIWNINYDLPRIVDVCRKYGIDPADVFSDPSVPVKLRYFRYKEGPSRKTKANGETFSISPANRWHIATSTSSFYFIDAMCVYRIVRLSLPEQQSYSLDNILQHELGIRKLKFTETDQYSGLQWHEVMQRKYKIEYIVYNIFDTLSMIELDEKTMDLSQAIGIFSGYSDFSNFNSQPRLLANQLHFVALENNLVIGSTSSNMREDIDDKTLSLNDWIVALPAHLIVDNGLTNIKEDNTLITNIHLYVSDSDIGAAYPSVEVTSNVSKGTTKTEVIDIKNIPEEVFRLQNINLLSGKVNAVDYCVNMFNFPTLSELEKINF